MGRTGIENAPSVTETDDGALSDFSARQRSRRLEGDRDDFPFRDFQPAEFEVCDRADKADLFRAGQETEEGSLLLRFF